MLLREDGAAMKYATKPPEPRNTLNLSENMTDTHVLNGEAGYNTTDAGIDTAPSLSSTASLHVDYDRYGDQFEYFPPKSRARKKKKRKDSSPHPTSVDHPWTNPRNENISTYAQKFPHYFIIGFAKTGTKALYELLKMHPQLAGPRREMRYFSSGRKQNLTNYLSRFPPPPANGYTIEKSPDYILSPLPALRLKEAAIESGAEASSLKFIVMFRNPVVRSVSDYLEMVSWSYMHRRPALPPFDKMVISPGGSVNDSVNIINSSCYSYHLKQWFNIFSKDQFCFVNGDQFITDPYTEAKALEECLHLNSFFTKKNFVFNNKRKLYCFKTSNAPMCMNGAKGRKHPFVSNEVVTTLKDYYRAYNEELYSLIGRNFNWESSMKF